MADKTDIVPELLSNLKKTFLRNYHYDAEIVRLTNLIKADIATYREAEEYSRRVGAILRSTMNECIKNENLPNGRMYYNIAIRVIEPMLRSTYSLTSKACKKVQESLNKEANLHIKAIVPAYESAAAKGIVNLATSSDTYDDVKKRVEAAAETMTAKVADRSVKANADFQYTSGLSPMIVREAAPGCCKWCTDIAGTYDYNSVKRSGNDVFRRHANCNCVIYYNPASGRRQNVHTKRYVDEEKVAKRVAKAEHMDIAAMECVNSVYNYKVVPLTSSINISYNQLYLEAMKKHVEGEDIQDEFMELLARKGYVRYDKTGI